MTHRSSEPPNDDTERIVESLDESIYKALLRGSLGQIRARRARLVRVARAASNNEALSLSIQQVMGQGLR